MENKNSPENPFALENHFHTFRNNIIGIDACFNSPYKQNLPILYADWTASGRMYAPIEHYLMDDIYPYVANTHTETNFTGKKMTHAYHHAIQKIKQHVNANLDDVLISSNSGMTGVLIKFQRILGLKIHERFQDQVVINPEDRPIVFVTHMEHHSNQTSWLETICDVEIIDPDAQGLVSLAHFESLLEKYKNRKTKIAAVTSCSNVTGILTPYHQIAKIIHQYGGLCFVDFACSAPYIHMDMHPEAPGAHLDAIYFSPHKFLGGPGSSGILVFNKALYQNRVPDHPGGGTVIWTNPWKGHMYIEDIETREDGGTPAFIQTIRVARCIALKEEMGIDNIIAREHEQLDILFPILKRIPNLHILAGHIENRMGVISFFIDDLHFNLGVQMLNDKFGIQTRGGCSCAGTYGHYLLHIDAKKSAQLVNKIMNGSPKEKPGWIRLSIHPTMTNDEIRFIGNALTTLADKHSDWAADYEADGEMHFKFCAQRPNIPN